MLPLRPRDKRPLTQNGLKDASIDPDVIFQWWTYWPDANIGLRTGVAFDVLDVDGPEGKTSMVEVAPGYVHSGPVASTGKGWHLLFAVTTAKNGANMKNKLDFRGQNGYIVAPPSIHPNGHRYAWARGDLGMLLPDAPDWLAEMLFPPRPEMKARRMTPRARAALDSTNVLDALAVIGCFPKPLGKNYIANCPFSWHQDDTPSLVVYPDTNSFFCFGCGYSPDKARAGWGDALNILKYQTDGVLR